MADTNTPSPIAEISHGPSKFDMFLDQHQKKLIILAVLATLGAISYIVWDGVKKIEQQNAGSALYNASGENELKKVIQEGTPEVQATGKYLLAREQATVDKTSAIKTLQDLVSTFPNQAITNDAKLQLGLLLLANQESEQAEKQLKTVSNDSSAGHLQAFAKFALAEIAMQRNTPSKATELYQDAAKLTKHYATTTEFESFTSLTSVQAPIRLVIPKQEATDKQTESKELPKSSANPIPTEK